MTPVNQFTVERLSVSVYADRWDMGRAAALQAAEEIQQRLRESAFVNLLFAAAPSQNEFLKELVVQRIDWSRVNAFHMDEYIGLPDSHPAGFANFLDRHIWNLVKPAKTYYLRPHGSVDDTARRYEELLREHPLDACFLGVGENGHIAFNDPSVADFADPLWVKEVMLDEMCRTQQVNDGCFATLDEVPTAALTVTVTGILSAKRLFCVVPGVRKAAAVRAMLCGPVQATCPASVLRTHPNAALYLDAAAYQPKKTGNQKE